MTGGGEGSPAEAEESPSILRPKLHHACGVAYRCRVEEKKKRERCSVTVCEEISFQFSVFFFSTVTCRACCVAESAACVCVCMRRGGFGLEVNLETSSSQTGVIYIKRTFSTWTIRLHLRRHFMIYFISCIETRWTPVPVQTCIQPEWFDTGER